MCLPRVCTSRQALGDGTGLPVDTVSAGSASPPHAGTFLSQQRAVFGADKVSRLLCCCDGRKQQRWFHPKDEEETADATNRSDVLSLSHYLAGDVLLLYTHTRVNDLL